MYVYTYCYHTSPEPRRAAAMLKINRQHDYVHNLYGDVATNSPTISSNTPLNFQRQISKFTPLACLNQINQYLRVLNF